MEKLIKAVGESVDRRWFLRMVGKLGMGAAAVAGVVLLPRRAYATDGCPEKPAGAKGNNPCWGKAVGERCTTKRGSGDGNQECKSCHINTYGGCDCTAGGDACD